MRRSNKQYLEGDVKGNDENIVEVSSFDFEMESFWNRFADLFEKKSLRRGRNCTGDEAYLIEEKEKEKEEEEEEKQSQQELICDYFDKVRASEEENKQLKLVIKEQEERILNMKEKRRSSVRNSNRKKEEDEEDADNYDFLPLYSDFVVLKNSANTS
jgi:hypothetical protein